MMRSAGDAGPATSIVASNPDEQRAAELPASWLRLSTGLPLAIQAARAGKSIRFCTDKSLEGEPGREEYLLKRGTNGVDQPGSR